MFLGGADMSPDIRLKWLPLFAFAAFLLSWMLPNHNYPWSTAYQEFASFFACLLLLLVIVLTRPLRLPLALAGFFLLPLIPLLQKYFGLIYFAGDAWVAAFYLCGFALMLVTGYNLALKSTSQQFITGLLANLFIVGAVLSLWIGLRQWLVVPASIWEVGMPFGARPSANFAQPNSLATLLCLGLAGVLFFYEKHKLGRLAAGLLAFFLLFGVALTQSRTPWVATIMVAIFWGWKARIYSLRLSLRALWCWIGVYVFCILALSQLAEWLLLYRVDPLGRAQSLERWDLWVQFCHAIWHGPLWGYGWNQVSVAQVAVTLDYPVQIVTQHSHNVLLDLLLWNGPVLGGLIIVCVSLWLLRLSVRARTPESLFAILSAGFLLVHAMLEFPLEYAFFLLPLGLLLGVAEAGQRSVREFRIPRLLQGGIFLGACGFFILVWHEYRIIEEDHRLMRFEVARIGDISAEQLAPDVMLLTQLSEYIRFARSPASEGMNRVELEWMRQVAHRYPYPFSLFRYALALALNGQSSMAHEQLLILKGLYGGEYYSACLGELLSMQERYPQLAELLILMNR